MSIFKIVALFIFIIIGIVLIAGGGPDSTGYIGTKYWHDQAPSLFLFSKTSAILLFRQHTPLVVQKWLF